MIEGDKREKIEITKTTGAHEWLCFIGNTTLLLFLFLNFLFFLEIRRGGWSIRIKSKHAKKFPNEKLLIKQPDQCV